MLKLEKSPKLLKILNEYPELEKLGDQKWRLNNLYWIKDKSGNKIKFKPNWAQQELLTNDHPCQIVLKARQLGITTYYSLYLLDQVLWNDYESAGILAQTFDDAISIFRDRLKFAFDNLHPAIKPLFKVIGDSAKELRFSHGSTIRVGTSLRGSTLTLLHLSEFGKICCKYPERATEIITGSLQTVSSGQKIFIESTAEGRDGYFYEMTQVAFEHARSGKPLGPLDYKPFFFSWWRHPDYKIEM